MTFEQFQATRQDGPLAQLAPDYEDASGRENATTGHVYLGRLVIEDVTEAWPAAARAEGRYYLILGNQEWIRDELAPLEGILYEYAAGEGLV